MQAKILASSLVCTMAFTALPALAAPTGQFTDLGAKDFGFDAAVYLQEKGIMKGYADGSFKPSQDVNRAEALKVIAESVDESNSADSKASISFTDVASDAWFAPYVKWAVKQTLVDGKAKTFRPSEGITKVEFLKILLLAQDVDPKSFGDIELPLASDVTDTKQWYYPFIRYAISSALITLPASGKFAPDRALTRIDVAVILYRFLLFQQHQRTQAQLDLTLADIVRALDALSKKNVKDAQYSSGRALLTARGAHETTPDAEPVKVAVKISEAVRALVRAYQAGISDDRDTVIKLSKDAWYLADQANQISPGAKTLADQIKTYATNFGKAARK